jgi:hypothetical protein
VFWKRGVVRPLLSRVLSVQPLVQRHLDLRLLFHHEGEADLQRFVTLYSAGEVRAAYGLGLRERAFHALG